MPLTHGFAKDILLRVPFIAVVPPLCLGIVFNNHYVSNTSSQTVAIVSAILGLMGVLAAIMLRKITPLVPLLFAVLGFTLMWGAQKPQIVEMNVKGQFVSQITDVPIIKGRYQNATARIICFKDSTGVWLSSDEKVLLSVDTTHIISIGEVISYTSKTYPFNPPYERYYASKQIIGRQYAYRVDSLTSDTTTVMRIDIFRNSIASRIAEADTAVPQSTAIMTALSVGLKTELSTETKRDYRNAGASHLLAISGLHVGIVFAILNFLLLGLNFFGNQQKIKSLIIISILWGFAVTSGLSPSVLRAVLMFSMLQIGIMYHRGNALNNLLASAFILLCVNPFYLYDLGFQLSYLAMTGITVLYKPLNDIWSPTNVIIRGLWGLTTITFAAQLFTAPLVALVFGQVSIAGLLVNMVVWLTVPVIIVGTALYLLVPLWWVGYVPVRVAEFQNWLMSVVGSQSWAVVNTEGISVWVCATLYVVLLGVGSYFLSRKCRESPHSP